MKIKKYTQFIIESSNNIKDINSMIDYTLLEEKSTDSDIISLCEKANLLGVKSVCVLPSMVKLAKENLKNSNVLVCTVISFPNGENTPSQKLNETSKAISDGADEIDMVLNYKKIIGETEDSIYDGGSKSIYDQLWHDEIQPLVEFCHDHKNKEMKNITLKVIVESGLLSEEETKLATEICQEGGADFIKTSTGKVPIGAELNKIKIMHDTINEYGGNMKIKASGGVRTLDQIDEFMPYVDRFGMGYSSVDILNNISSSTNNSY